MKSILLAILFLFIPKPAISQVTSVDKTIYLDSLFRETSKINHSYYKVIKDYYSNQKSYEIKEYYKSGALETEWTSANKEGYSIEGKQTCYYENGNKKSVTNYIKGRVNGKDFEWYENGNKKLEGEYFEDENKHTNQHKIHQFWDINGVQEVIDGNGFFENQEKKEFSKGEIKNGLKEGPWEGSFEKSFSYKEKYKNGKLISGVSTDKNGTTYPYTELEIRPEPKNGIMDFYKYIGKNYKLPNIEGLNGKVYITFVVDKDGKIVEPKVLRDLGYGTGAEAIRIMKNCDNWSPGEQRGRKVRCTYSLPISINTSN